MCGIGTSFTLHLLIIILQIHLPRLLTYRKSKEHPEVMETWKFAYILGKVRNQNICLSKYTILKSRPILYRLLLWVHRLFSDCFCRLYSLVDRITLSNWKLRKPKSNNIDKCAVCAATVMHHFRVSLWAMRVAIWVVFFFN